MSLITKPTDVYGNRTWKVTTLPETEPITVDNVKEFGRIDTTAEDILLGNMIIAVRDATEKYLNRALVQQTITMVMDFWPDSLVIELPSPPLISVTGIYTTTEAGVDTAYSSSNYYVITNTDSRGKIVLSQSATPPTNSDRDYGGFKIIYVAGYGDEASDVPQLILEGMKLWVSIFYETRALYINGQPPPEVKAFLDLYRVPKI